MGWFGGASDTNTSTSSNTYGTHTPTLTPQWEQAFNNFSGSIDPTTGANTLQQSAINWGSNFLNSANPVDQGTTTANLQLAQPQKDLYNIAGVAGGIANNTVAPQAAPSGQVTAQTGTAAAQPYLAMYGQDLVNPALAAYDYGTGRSMAALDARTAGAGGFANSRSGINYGDLSSQAALGRGQLYASIEQPAITSSLGFGASDQSRQLAADTTNVGNTNQVNEFNVNAQQQATAQRLSALNTAAQATLSQAGLSQQVLQNIITDQGIDANAAQQLFTAGTITSAQLAAILSAASASNGYTYSQDTSGNSNTSKVSIGSP